MCTDGFNGEMMLVVQYDLPTLRYRAPLPHVLCSVVSVFVSGGVGSLLLTGLGREKKRTPLFSSSLKETLCAWATPSAAHKGKRGMEVRVWSGVIITAKGQARYRLSDPLLR